ncbi:MAG: bifunctional adenosylcobinamide kinase/adenosylcobinamide-phosphate guanylyltransferase [Gammaproteobacteria bacterium]|nr:bifunctional adenosylcobinamide kinase/adenosylcobinamide-phosphate guanylyltransferase [Gammaproteobacteria bacterium]
MKELILGGVRSGKSALAELRAGDSGMQVIYLATATAGDDEMAARIKLHQQQRPDNWLLIEEPVELAQTLKQYANINTCILVDCLTLWLTNLLLEDEQLIPVKTGDLLDSLSSIPGRIIFVSNEVGGGIIPADALSRRFCDEAGRLHQQLAACCDRVTLVVAGLAQQLKP